MVSFRGQKKLELRPDRSLLGVLIQKFRRAPSALSYVESPPRGGPSEKIEQIGSGFRPREKMSLTGRLGRFCPSRDHLIAGCQLSFRRVKNFRTKNLKIFLARSIKVPISVACGKFLQLRLDWFQRKQKGSGE